jgi:two-component system, LytTR family, response regulator
VIHRVLIVDDEPLARERLAELVRLTAPGAAITEAGNGDAAVEILLDRATDVVLLDVQMPGRDGFEVIRSIGTERMPLTIFVTAYDQHAMRAFDVSAVDYLLKPFDDERFRAAWHRAEARYTMQEVVSESRRLATLIGHVDSSVKGKAPAEPPQKRYADRIVVKKDERTSLVKLADVQWIESKGNYVILHTGRADHVVRETLASLESRLDPEKFVRIHRRIIVAIDAIKEVQPWFGGDQVMILRDLRQLRVSRTFRQRLVARLSGQG